MSDKMILAVLMVGLFYGALALGSVVVGVALKIWEGWKK